MRFSYKKIIGWLLIVCTLYCCSKGCLEEERRILLQIKDSTGYRKHIYPLASWVGENCCEWPGVFCRPSSSSNSSSLSHVVSIDLWHRRQDELGIWYPNASHFARLHHLEFLFLSDVGRWWVNPQGLCGMKNLKILDLSRNNNLDDEDLPSCLLTNSSNLEELNLGGNNFRSLDGFIHIKSLKKLSLWSNRLNESIDSLSRLCKLRNLKSLDLSYNNLDQENIPSCLLMSSWLEELNLRKANIRSLDGFDKLKSLRTLDLSGSRLNQSINSISALCGMSNLKRVFLSGNNLDNEQIPSCWSSNSSNKLEELYMGANNLRSVDGLGNLKSLRVLSLRQNRLNESMNSLSGLCGMKILRSLNLSYNNLDGIEILTCLSSKLEELTLEGNNLRSLDGLRQYSNLQILNLRQCQLTDRNIGLWISNLTSLVSLKLSNNQLKDPGKLKGLCSLRNLRNLDLFNNSIEGQIPTCFKDLYSLREFDLCHNLFTGSIPHSIFDNLTMIEAFDIGHNQLDGVIPFFMFANLSKLQSLDLSNNPQSQVETEYPHWTPTFQLSALFLTRCNVSSNVPNFLSSQRNLKHFESDYSFLNGPIPSWILYNATTPMLISLRGNKLDGAFPKSSQTNPSMLFKLDISDNHIRGTLPKNTGSLFPMLIHFNASRNALQGNIPESIEELAMLVTLDLSQNKLSGEISWGLSRNKNSLKSLILSENHFEGQIFSRNFNASSLLALVLHGNHFNGSITWSLTNSQSLMFLDVRNNELAGPIPGWLSTLPQLVSILLGGNNFTGHIPLDLCQMENLRTLDLSNNALSGSVPSCLNGITPFVKSIPMSYETAYETFPTSNVGTKRDIRLTMDFATKGSIYTYEGIPLFLMTGLDLSMNKLTGDIPPQVGDLKELHTLNLSNNCLTGPIPESFKHLVNMESMDLSHNELAGSIPVQLAQLNFLTTFSVRFNNLSGKIPSGGQFNTFNASSYVGNLDLCGAPVERNCSLDDPPQAHDGETDDEDLDILSRPVIFYLWVLFSFALGFSSFNLILIFKSNWRSKYFKIVDKYVDSTVRGIRKSWLVRKSI